MCRSGRYCPPKQHTGGVEEYARRSVDLLLREHARALVVTSRQFPQAAFFPLFFFDISVWIPHSDFNGSDLHPASALITCWTRDDFPSKRASFP